MGVPKKRLVVIGIDGLGYTNLMNFPGMWMPNLRRLCRENLCLKIDLDAAISPRNWVRVFSGVDLKWYNLYIKLDRIENGVDKWRLITRDELPVKFIWDLYPDLVVINAPVVIPPITKNSEFQPVGYGLPFTFFEWFKEIQEVRKHTLKAIRNEQNVIAVFTVIDRMLHITAKEDVVKRIAIELDEAVRIIIEEARARGYAWIIVSDHGMKRTTQEVEGSVTPRHDMPWIRTVTKAIHDHSNDALYITNTGIGISRLEDVFSVMRRILGP